MAVAVAEARRVLDEQFARVGKAVAHPKRVELLDLLAQGERGVNALAAASGMGVTNTSAHLQVLRSARLVETRRDGSHVLYRLAGDEVETFLAALRDLARARLFEVERVMSDYLDALDDLEPIGRDELARRIVAGDVVVIDVRPPEEYAAGHIHGALSLPLEQLDDGAGLELLRRLGDRPDGTADGAEPAPPVELVEIVAYCRGPFCVLASEAVERLRGAGWRARRLEDGLPEWRRAGLPVAVGER